MFCFKTGCNVAPAGLKLTVARDNLELLALLLLPPECLDSGHAPTYMVDAVLGPKALRLLGSFPFL